MSEACRRQTQRIQEQRYLLEKLQQSRERERKYESMLRVGMQLFASKIGLNLNNLTGQFPT